MVGNILRMIGIVEIYEKKTIQKHRQGLKEVSKAALHEKPWIFL